MDWFRKPGRRDFAAGLGATAWPRAVFPRIACRCRRGDRMNRREIIAALGAVAASPLLALAQPGEQMRRVGVLMSFLQDDPAGAAEVAALRQGLADLGWIEGRNIRI